MTRISAPFVAGVAFGLSLVATSAAVGAFAIEPLVHPVWGLDLGRRWTDGPMPLAVGTAAVAWVLGLPLALTAHQARAGHHGRAPLWQATLTFLLLAPLTLLTLALLGLGYS